MSKSSEMLVQHNICVSLALFYYHRLASLISLLQMTRFCFNCLFQGNEIITVSGTDCIVSVHFSPIEGQRI